MTADDGDNAVGGGGFEAAARCATPVRAGRVPPSGGEAIAYPRLRIPWWPALEPPKVWLVDFRLAGGSVPAQRSAAESRPVGPAT